MAAVWSGGGRHESQHHAAASGIFDTSQFLSQYCQMSSLDGVKILSDLGSCTDCTQEYSGNTGFFFTSLISVQLLTFWRLCFHCMNYFSVSVEDLEMLFSTTTGSSNWRGSFFFQVAKPTGHGMRQLSFFLLLLRQKPTQVEISVLFNGENQFFFFLIKSGPTSMRCTTHCT